MHSHKSSRTRAGTPDENTHVVIERTPASQGYSLGALLLAAALPAYSCWDDAASRYQVSSQLLHAIARTESGLNPHAVGKNRDGSRDIGLMQINSGWLPALARFGIHEQDLFEPCTSIHVGAWILAQNVARYGYNWEAVGAYNASSATLRRAYAARVHKNLPAPRSTGHPANSAAAADLRSREHSLPMIQP